MQEKAVLLIHAFFQKCVFVNFTKCDEFFMLSNWQEKKA